MKKALFLAMALLIACSASFAVMVRIAYNGEMAKEAAKKAVRKELEKKGENLHEQLDKVLGF